MASSLEEVPEQLEAIQDAVSHLARQSSPRRIQNQQSRYSFTVDNGANKKKLKDVKIQAIGDVYVYA